MKKRNGVGMKDPTAKAEYVRWIKEETIAGLKRAGKNTESIRTAVFLYLNRAYEAGLAPDEITDLFGVIPDSILAKAKLDQNVEQQALIEFEILDPNIEGTWENRDCPYFSYFSPIFLYFFYFILH